jgi:hypothetical protein
MRFIKQLQKKEDLLLILFYQVFYMKQKQSKVRSSFGILKNNTYTTRVHVNFLALGQYAV